MSKILFTAIAYLNLCAIAQASEYEPFNLEGLPNDVIVHVTKFMMPHEAYAVATTNKRLSNLKSRIKEAQMPNMYREIGKDYTKALMQFPHPRWNLDEQMPAHIKTIIHDLYLTAQKIADPHKRFCYLMAAGRVGHAFAAEEAGQLLLDLPAVPMEGHLGFISVNVSVEDLKKVDWDIAVLDESLIKDPELKRINEEKVRKLNEVKIAYNRKLMVNCSYEEMIADHESYVMQFRAIIEEAIKQLRSIENNDSEECQLLMSSYTFNFGEIEYNLVKDSIRSIENVMGDYKDVDLEDSGLVADDVIWIRKIRDHSDKLMKYFSAKLLELEEPSLNRFKYLNGGRTSSPYYWALFSAESEMKGEWEKNLEYLRQIANLILRAKTCANIANRLYKLNNMDGQNSHEFQDIVRVEQEAKSMLIISVLLGNQDACKILKEKMAGSTHEDAGESDKEIIEYYKQWDALTAFAVQLNLMRSPDSIQAHQDAIDFYSTVAQQESTINRLSKLNERLKCLKREAN